jgi:hypothetical protein
MASDKLIAVDFSQQKATSKVISNSNRLSSHQAGWNGMYLEYHRRRVRSEKCGLGGLPHEQLFKTEERIREK